MYSYRLLGLGVAAILVSVGPVSPQADGAPAAGVPVSLGVVDKSLFYIQPEQSPDVRRFYYGSRRGDSIRRAHSLGYSHAGWFADHSGRPQAR